MSALTPQEEPTSTHAETVFSKFRLRKVHLRGVETADASNKCQVAILRVGSRHTTPTDRPGMVKGRALVAKSAATCL